MFVYAVLAYAVALAHEARSETIYGFVYQVSNNTIYIENIHGKYQVYLAGIVMPEFGQDYVEETWPLIARDIVRKTVKVNFEDIDDTGTMITGDVYLRDRWINRELVEQALERYYQSHPRAAHASRDTDQSQRLERSGVWNWWYFLSRKSPIKFNPLRPSIRSAEKATATAAKSAKPPDDSPQYALRGIDSVAVTVGTLPGYFARDGITADQIRLDVESQLRRYGLRVAENDTGAVLHITVKILPYQKVNTYMSVEVRVFRDRSPAKASDSIWDISSFSYFGDSGGRTIDENISNKVQIFVGDYLAVN